MKFCWHNWVTIKSKTKRQIFEDVIYNFCKDNYHYEFIKKFSKEVESKIIWGFLDSVVYSVKMCSKCEKIKDQIEKEFIKQYFLVEHYFTKFKIEIETKEKYYEKYTKN